MGSDESRLLEFPTGLRERQAPVTHDQRAQIQSACDRAAKLIANNDRALLRARRLLQTLNAQAGRPASPRSVLED
jgi:hypothetical protein